MKNSPPPPENPFINILVNIILPVVILNKGGNYLDPKWNLVIALSLPLSYGIQDYIRRKHKNYVSLLGIVNIFLTGGLALMNVEGIWFAFKEASLPLILGLLVLASRWSKNPAAQMLFCNPHVLDMNLVEERLQQFSRQEHFRQLLNRTTIWLSFSFLISAILNWFLAYKIFTAIDPTLIAAERERLLNEQIAQMTWMGFVVIAVPLMAFSGILVTVFLRRISSLTEIPLNTLLKS